MFRNATGKLAMLLMVSSAVPGPTSAFSPIASSSYANSRYARSPSLVQHSCTSTPSGGAKTQSSSLLSNGIVLAASEGLADPNPESSDSTPDQRSSLRDSLRKMTGFSLTALRKTMRAATGLSLTTIYATSVAATGAWIRTTTKLILGLFPAWFRYFLQPLLILYYTPLFIIRNLTGPTRREALKTHEHFVEGYKQAVQVADEHSSYWPVHVNKDGDLEKDFAELDLNEVVADSVEVAMEEKSRDS